MTTDGRGARLDPRESSAAKDRGHTSAGESPEVVPALDSSMTAVDAREEIVAGEGCEASEVGPLPDNQEGKVTRRDLSPFVGSRWRHVGSAEIPASGLVLEVVASDSHCFYASYPGEERHGAIPRRYGPTWNERDVWVEVSDD